MESDAVTRVTGSRAWGHGRRLMKIMIRGMRLIKTRQTYKTGAYRRRNEGSDEKVGNGRWSST